MNKKNNKKKIATLALTATMLAQTVVPIATFAKEGLSTDSLAMNKASDVDPKSTLDYSKVDKYLKGYNSSDVIDPSTSNYPEYIFYIGLGLFFKETGKNTNVTPTRDVTQEDINELYKNLITARKDEIIIPALEKNYPTNDLLREGRAVDEEGLEAYVEKADAFFNNENVNPIDIVDGKVKPEPTKPEEPEEPTNPTEEDKNHAIGDEFLNLIKDEESNKEFLKNLEEKQDEFGALFKELKDKKPFEEKELTLVVSDMTLNKGEKEKIKFENPEDATLNFEIYENQDNVIKLEGNTVEALKAGTAKILVKATKDGYKEKTIVANITVKEIKPEDDKKELSLTISPIEIKVGETATVKLENPEKANLKYEIYENKDNVIKLEGEKITGLKEGKATIKVTANKEGYKTKEITVTVDVKKEVKNLNDIKKDLVKDLKALENLSSDRKEVFEKAINEATDENKAKEQLDLAKKEDNFKKKEIEKINDIKNISDEKKKELIKKIKDAETEKDVTKIIEEAKDLNEKAEDISLTTKVVYDKKDKEKATIQIETIKPTDKKKVTVKVTSEDKDVKLDYEKEVDKDGKASIEVKRLKKDYRINVKIIVKEEGKDTLTKNKSVKIQKQDANVLEFDVKDIKLTKKSDDRYELTFTVKDAPKDMKIEVNGNNVKYNIDKDGNAKVIYDLRDLKNDTKLKIKITADGYKEFSYEKKVKDVQEVKSFTQYVVGYPDGTFGPERTITRAEAVAMFTRLVRGRIETNSRTTRYSDANNAWYSDALNYATEKGYISGYNNGRFNPNDNMTREEFAQMISKYVSENVNKIENNTLLSFKDVSDKKWSSSAIQEALERGIIKGYEDGTFKGNKDITRAEAVKMLNRTFDRKTTEKSITKDIDAKKLNMFKDVSPKHWAFYEILDASNNHKANVTDSNRTWSK